MPKDIYIFFALLACLIALRFVNISPGIHFFLFSLVVVGQVVFLAWAFTRGKGRKPDEQREPEKR